MTGPSTKSASCKAMMSEPSTTMPRMEILPWLAQLDRSLTSTYRVRDWGTRDGTSVRFKSNEGTVELKRGFHPVHNIY